MANPGHSANLNFAERQIQSPRQTFPLPSVNGPEYDLSIQHLDGEAIMRVRGGKKHGRYSIVNSTLDTATTPTLWRVAKISQDIRIHVSPSTPDVRTVPLPNTINIFKEI